MEYLISNCINTVVSLCSAFMTELSEELLSKRKMSLSATGEKVSNNPILYVLLRNLFCPCNSQFSPVCVYIYNIVI